MKGQWDVITAPVPVSTSKVVQKRGRPLASCTPLHPLRAATAITIILISTTLVSFNTYFAANSLDDMFNQPGLTIGFVDYSSTALWTNDLEPTTAGYHGDLDL